MNTNDPLEATVGGLAAATVKAVLMATANEICSPIQQRKMNFEDAKIIHIDSGFGDQIDSPCKALDSARVTIHFEDDTKKQLRAEDPNHPFTLSTNRNSLRIGAKVRAQHSYVTISQSLREFFSNKGGKATISSIMFVESDLPAAWLKMPLFEVMQIALRRLDISPSWQGIVAGATYATLTYPLGLFAYFRGGKLRGWHKQENIPETPMAMCNNKVCWVATTVRDVVYGMVNVNVKLYVTKYATFLNKIPEGPMRKFVFGFMCTWFSLLMASPANEINMYMLRAQGMGKSPWDIGGIMEFFKLSNCVQSAGIVGIIIATSLGFGGAVAQDLNEMLKRNIPGPARKPVALIMVLVAFSMLGRGWGKLQNPTIGKLDPNTKEEQTLKVE